MSNAGAIKAGGAYVVIGANTAPFMRALQEVQRRTLDIGNMLKQTGAAMMAVSASIAAPLALSAKLFADVGSKVYDMSRRTGLSAEAVSGLAYAAEQSGAGLEVLEVGVRKMQNTIADAAGGSKAAAAALAKFGLSAQDLMRLSPDEQLARLATAMTAITDESQRTAAMVGVFGKSGTALIPMLEAGGAGLAQMRAEAQRLGITLSSEDAAAADALGDALHAATKAARGAALAVGAALARPLQQAAMYVAELASATARWIRQHQAVVYAVAAGALGLATLGAGLIATGLAMKAAAVAAAVVSTALGVMQAVLVSTRVVMLGLLSPVGLVATAAGVLAAAWLKESGAIQGAIAWLSARFSGLAATVGEVMGEIVQLLQQGDMAAASRLAWAAVKVVWETALADLKILVVKLWNELKQSVSNVLYSIAHVALNTWYNIAEELAKNIDWMKDSWDKYRDHVKDVEQDLNGKQDVPAGPDLNTLQHGYNALADTWGTLVDEPLAWLMAPSGMRDEAWRQMVADNLAKLAGNERRFVSSDAPPWTDEMRQIYAAAEAAVGPEPVKTNLQTVQEARDKAQAELDAKLAKRQQAAQNAADTGVAAAEAAKDAAARDLERALARARGARVGKGGPLSDLYAQQRVEFDPLPPMAEQLRQAAEAAGKLQLDSVVSFSGRAAGLIGGGVGERMIEGQRQTNELLRRIDHHVQDSGATFS